MSGAMEEAMRAWERGLSSVPEKKVCSSHINDEAIRLFINRTGAREVCSYCGYSKKVVELEVLMEYITDSITHFYTDPANFLSYISSEGGYQGNVYDGSEILNEQMELEILGNELFNDIHESLDPFAAWSNEYEYKNDADYKFENWINFKKVVKNKSRFLFSSNNIFKLNGTGFSVIGFLKEFGREIRRMKMIATLKTGTAFYRCRQHENIDDVKSAEDICAPKTKHAIFPNRMSPAGISMFYGAFQIDTAQKETIDYESLSKTYHSIAEFKTIKELNLIDLSLVPSMPSQFEQRKWNVYYLIAFLHAFVEDFTKGIDKDGHIHIEYVPTQVVTEYFRYEFNKVGSRKIDGIIYPSSKNKGFNACVLFMGHNKSLKELEFISSSLETFKI